MRIQFKIKETFTDIVSEIFASKKWEMKVFEERKGLKRVTLKDPVYDSCAYIEIWEREIHIKTAWSNYTYRIFAKGEEFYCEYIGAYRGLLKQRLLPTLTPAESILDIEVIDTSLPCAPKESLRQYGAANARRRRDARMDHPAIVKDEFIKEGMPVPSPRPVR